MAGELVVAPDAILFVSLGDWAGEGEGPGQHCPEPKQPASDQLPMGGAGGSDPGRIDGFRSEEGGLRFGHGEASRSAGPADRLPPSPYIQPSTGRTHKNLRVCPWAERQRLPTPGGSLNNVPNPNAAGANVDHTFEVVITMPKGLPANASALAERFIEVGLGMAAEEMKAAYGESMELASVRLLEPSK